MGKRIKQDPAVILEEKLDRLQRRREFKQLFAESVILVGAIYVLLHYIIGIAFVSGSSMEPTLLDGELVVFYRLDKEYRKDDIVIIQCEDGIQYVKRIAACGNEQVEISEEGVETSYEVPAGTYFVLGDNQADSIDSRMFGAVKQEEIVGRVFFHLGMTQ
ncbi:MAG: signal peptidase I [Lachnospiraceae bacterium]|nr:signal peptidase I [Lachnospiraceae bacterium]